MIDGVTHHFSCGGLYDGLAMLIDDETHTYWDHITGEALHGPLTGRTLEVWGIEMMSVKEVLAAYPEIDLAMARPPLMFRLLGGFVQRRAMGTNFRLPWFFRRTMGVPDPRLPELTSGLGVVEGKLARFYPVTALKARVSDVLGSMPLTVELSADRVPFALRSDGTRPMQIFLRWYGFALSYPHAQVFAPRDSVGASPQTGSGRADA